ncbi:MAG: glycosyltransferase family 4 protein [Elusimicrobiota bacterium]
MKIAFVVHTAYPDCLGGREHHIHHLASELSKTDDVIVISGGTRMCSSRKKIGGYTLLTLPTFSLKVSSNPLQIYRFVFGVFRALWKEKPDIVHAFEYGSNTTDTAFIFSKISGTPLILTVYGYHFSNPFLRFMKKIYDFFIGRPLLYRTRMIICNSEVQAEEIYEITGKTDIEKRIVYQGNCIDVDAFETAEKNPVIIEKYGLKGKTIILTIARILPRKGIRYLIFSIDRAVSHYKKKGIKLLIVGPDCGEMKNLQGLINKKNLQEYVLFTGQIPPDKIRDFLNTCDVFVLPSLYEGLPLALLEAMSAGKASVFTTLPCSHQVIKTGETGMLVSPADVDELTEAIVTLIDDSQLREEIGRKAASAVRKFSSVVEAERIRKRYQGVIRRYRPGL